MRLKGGMRWKQGSDTCVFKPSLACKDGRAPANLPGMLSRVVETGSPDIQTETQLRELFPKLVKRGLITVHVQACTPEFSSKNLEWAPNLNTSGSCRLPGYTSSYINLITPEYTGNLYSYLIGTQRNSFKIGKQRALEVLRGAICAAVALVPDNKRWVIHGDLHFGNVLVKREFDSKTPSSQTYTSLADWGRSITFDSGNVNSVFDGLTKYLSLQSSLWKDFDSFLDMAKEPGVQAGTFPQYSVSVFHMVNAFHSNHEDHRATVQDFELALAALRGWMVYSLLKQYNLYYGLPQPSWLPSLLQTKTQQQLITILNTRLPKISGEDYYSVRFLENQPIPLVLSPVPAINLGGGTRRTRNTKRPRSFSLKVKKTLAQMTQRRLRGRKRV
jgi:hypothetical protein